MIFQVIASVLLSIGGGGAIVFGLSSFLAKVWANRILEAEKAAHAEEIQKFKQKLDVELAAIKASNDKAVYITKSQYDKEFEIYMNIWECFIELRFATERLYPEGVENSPTDDDALKKFNDKKMDDFSKAYDKFIVLIRKFGPFYKKEFYDEFEEIREICYKVFRIFKRYNFDKYNNTTYTLVKDTMNITPKESDYVYDESHKLIKENHDYMLEVIREYLLNLQVIQN